MNKVYYLPKTGSFYKIEKFDDKFQLLYTPAGESFLTFHNDNWNHLGYMGNDPNLFDTEAEAIAFIKGMKFISNV